MKELLLSLGAALIAIIAWWLKDQPKRVRLKLLEELESLEDEAKLALAAHDTDRLAIIHNRLRYIRAKTGILAGKR